MNKLVSISAALKPLTEKLMGKHGFNEIDIILNWEKIIGTDLAQYSTPLKIDFKKNEHNNGILNLSVPTGAFALEIKHREKFILEKINGYFGYQAVSGLKIIQNNNLSEEDFQKNTPVKEKKILVTEDEENYINKQINEIQNDDLKEILKKLGKDIISENKK